MLTYSNINSCESPKIFFVTINKIMDDFVHWFDSFEIFRKGKDHKP